MMTSMKPRTVRFALDCENSICLVPHFNEYSPSERSSLWLSVEECRAIKREAKLVVDKMNLRRQHGDHQPVYQCTRGLECRTAEGAEYKRNASLDSICAVVLEQERQRLEGRCDQVRIKEVYEQMSCTYVQDAIQRGAEDVILEKHSAKSGSKWSDNSLMCALDKARRRGKGRVHRLIFRGERSNDRSPIPPKKRFL